MLPRDSLNAALLPREIYIYINATPCPYTLDFPLHSITTFYTNFGGKLHESSCRSHSR